MIDLYTSRRDKFLECEYWSQEENPDYVESSEIAYKGTPTGSFVAKEANSYNVENQVIGELFMVESVTVVLITEDDVSNLKRNDIVKFDDKEYRVDNIQIAPKKKQRQYLRDKYSKEYYISLRG